MTRDESIEFLKRMKWQADYVEMGDDEGDEALDMAIEALKQPELVRCKECTFCQAIVPGLYFWCDRHKCFIEQEDFCNYGERKEQ